MELLISLAFLISIQSGPPSLASIGPGVFTATERARLERELKVDNRIKIYEAASKRYLRSVQDQIQKEQFKNLEPEIGSWLSMLSFSLKDIDHNVQRRKKSRSLIHYEIELRKAIEDMKDLRLKAVGEADAAFDKWLNEAEIIRNTFVDILFAK